MASQTGINYKTLEFWRHNLRLNPSWTPESHGHKGVPRKLTPDIEAIAAERLKSEFVDQQRLCPRLTVKAVLEETSRAQGSDITVGRTLLDNFMRRNELSMRTSHLKRRTAPNDEVVARFTERMDLVRAEFDPDFIVNVDETCWRLVNGRMKTLAIRGATDVTVKTKIEPKTDITAIAGCTMAGRRLPLWIIAKGKTSKCEEKYRQHPKLRHFFCNGSLVVCHSPKGWATEQVAVEYMKWLKDLYKDRKYHILWDLHSSHRSDSVKEWAANHDVALTFVPAGQTDHWQPLDRRIFGSLKQRALQRLAQKVTEGGEFAGFDIIDAVVVLLECWDHIEEDEFRGAWSVFQE